MSSRSFKSQNRGAVVTVKPKNNSNMNKNRNAKKKNQPKKRRNKRRAKRNVGLNGPINRPMPFGGKDSKVVPFREIIATVNGTVGFNSTKYPLNPGQASVFPWLSKEAAQWEKYRWRKMCFYYTPQVNEFSSNNTGTIILSIDTDASDPAPADLQHALDVRPNSKGQLPAREFVFDVPVKMLNLMTDGFYVRPGNLPGGTDIKTYDCANLFLSTVGNTNTNLCGYITVEYEVEFFIPILESSASAPSNNVISMYQSTAVESVASSGVVQNMLFANEVTNGLTVTNTAGSFVLPSGLYLIDLQVQSISAGAIMSDMTLDIKKNGTSVFTVLPEIAPLSNNAQMSLSWYTSSNGTDTFTFPVSTTFSAGTSDVSGVVRFTAI